MGLDFGWIGLDLKVSSFLNTACLNPILMLFYIMEQLSLSGVDWSSHGPLALVFDTIDSHTARRLGDCITQQSVQERVGNEMMLAQTCGGQSDVIFALMSFVE